METTTKYSFNKHTALVTGAGRGIGRAVAVALSNCGAKVYAVSRTEESLASLKLECPDIQTICLDVSNWNNTLAALQHIEDIDLVVNNAGISILESCLETSEENIDKVFDVNVKAAINVSQIFGKKMVASKHGGCIVNISSAASSQGLPQHLGYCLSKAALDSVTKTMAVELGPHKIRVNCVNPTAVMTDMGKMAWSDPVKSGALLARIPVGKFAEVSDVVNAVLFLLSDDSAYLNGVCLPVDGGLLVA